MGYLFGQPAVFGFACQKRVTLRCFVCGAVTSHIRHCLFPVVGDILYVSAAAAAAERCASCNGRREFIIVSPVKSANCS